MEGQVSAFLSSSEFELAYTPSTRLAYQNDLNRFLHFLEEKLGHSPKVSDFTGENVADFLQSEQKAGRRMSTLLRRRASLRRFASYLRKNNPDWDQSLEGQTDEIQDAIDNAPTGKKTRYLNHEQIDLLWNIHGDSRHPRALRDGAILALLLESALTVRTLLELNTGDLDLDGKQLLLHNDEEEVFIQLEKCLQRMHDYIEDGRPELSYQPDEPALFISQTGGRMSRQSVWQVLRQWGKKAGLPFTLSPRLVRHTAVVQLLEDGKTADELQAMLGHTNPLSTQALLRRLSMDIESVDGANEEDED